MQNETKSVLGDKPVIDKAKAFLEGAPTTMSDVDEIVEDYVRLHKLVNSPHIIDFTEAEILEAAFQQEKWGANGDEGKTDADWFWLIGYLAGKALHNPDTTEKNADKKRLHRIITIAAAARNWHAAVLGKTNMRPGIEPPVEIEA